MGAPSTSSHSTGAHTVAGGRESPGVSLSLSFSLHLFICLNLSALHQRYSGEERPTSTSATRTNATAVGSGQQAAQVELKNGGW